MNYQNRDFCYYHPKQILNGVCPFCLNEKLLVLAAEKGRQSHLRPRQLRHHSHQEGGGRSQKSGDNVGVTKMFALRSLLSRLELRHRHRSRRRSSDCDDIGPDNQSTSTSLDDSFISIKFEDNGVALWDNNRKNKPSKTSQPNKPFGANTNTGLTELDPNRKKSTNGDTSVVDHEKTLSGSLRWRNRIGHLLKLIKWKKSNKGSGKGTSHVDGVGGVVKMRSKGWIRTFTRRKTSKE